MKISVVVPAYNEQDNINNLIERIEEGLGVEHELIIVDDHSEDRTKELIRQASARYANVRLIENNLPRGFANALKTGFTSMNTGIVVPVMADLCDDLSTIKKMLDEINRGYDIVCGCRYIKGGRRLGGSKLKGAMSFLAGWSLYYILGLPTHDIANAFKMYRRKVLDNISIDSNGFEISMEIPLKAYYAGFKITEVPTVWKERQKGKSNFKIVKLLPDYLKLYIWAIFRRFAR